MSLWYYIFCHTHSQSFSLYKYQELYLALKNNFKVFFTFPLPDKRYEYIRAFLIEHQNCELEYLSDMEIERKYGDFKLYEYTEIGSVIPDK